MNYLLVENKQIVHLGPVPWKHRFIQAELDDLEVYFNVNPTETGYVKINDKFELIPLVEDITPDYDIIYHHLAGPFYTYNEQPDGTFTATMTHTIHDNPLESIKGHFKQIVANERYRKENMGTTANVQGQIVTVDTSRENRNTLVQAFLLMSNTDTINWKFPEGFITLSYSEIESVVATGALYIQAQFDWEVAKNAELDACTSVEEIKAVEILPANPPLFPGI